MTGLGVRARASTELAWVAVGSSASTTMLTNAEFSGIERDMLPGASIGRKLLLFARGAVGGARRLLGDGEGTAVRRFVVDEEGLGPSSVLTLVCICNRGGELLLTDTRGIESIIGEFENLRSSCGLVLFKLGSALMLVWNWVGAANADLSP